MRTIASGRRARNGGSHMNLRRLVALALTLVMSWWFYPAFHDGFRYGPFVTVFDCQAYGNYYNSVHGTEFGKCVEEW